MLEDVKIGDKILAIKEDSGLGDYSVGDELTVVREHGGQWYVLGDEIEVSAFSGGPFTEANKRMFVPVMRLEQIAASTEGWVLEKDGQFSINGVGQLGVARPILETRKIGKNRIELVDNGFPNALWEIARLMTKAQEVKGYKDHDWKNLPVETFSAAASRHRMKTNMGEFYDDEFEGFEILHKVNEAFNVLAELELMLTDD